jgi:formylglycine-generating enzyme
MGSPLTERGRRADETQADVTLSGGFWAGKFEVTQGQWRRVAGAFPDRLPSPAFGQGDEFPMYWVSYEQAEQFCQALTSRARDRGALPAAWAFTLPTEAQWEYACRAGTVTATAFGDALTTGQANFDPEADTRTTRLAGGARPVGSYPANAWGLHDMHGNVWEWCRDYYHGQLPGGADPDLSGVPGVQNGDGSYSRVRRGGAWIESERMCRSACRLRYEPYRGSDHIGFRVIVAES